MFDTDFDARRFLRKTKLIARLKTPQASTVTKRSVKPALSIAGASKSRKAEDSARDMVVITPTYNGSFSGGLTIPSSRDAVIP